MVYHNVFDVLTHERKLDLTCWQEHDEWPSNDFTDYRNLLLVCRL